MSTPPLAHRALATFADPRPERVGKLLDVYRDASRATLTATSEQIALRRELHQLEQDEDVDAGTVLVSLQRRREIHQELETLDRILADAGAREEAAVVVAEAARAAGVMFPTSSLSASSTHDAIMAGMREGISNIDAPLTAADRARRERRRR